MKPVQLHSEVGDEIEAAYRFYAERDEAIAARFLDEVSRVR